ncbi:unnamed protein product [Prorocentrum cordatum]|uniref:Glycerophosphocholine acyltransferase 1 n=1 Tax=Prorocentrum cordatum TaxID=2364126 RepID=A0ABN9PIN4_9DINO|nr:unnamed protein product [Polarella glacialis]
MSLRAAPPEQTPRRLAAAAELRRRVAAPESVHAAGSTPQPCLGWSIAVCAVAAWVVVVYTTLVAKAMPVTGWAVLDWVRADTFFCHLLPMLLPTLVLFRYWSWYSLESFKNT